MKMKIRKKQNQYAQVHQNMLRDRNLSLKAKGLGAILESYSDDFEVSMKAIEARSHDGEKSIASAAKELESGHYLYRFQSRGERGHYITYWVFDSQTIDDEYLESILVESDNIQIITENVPPTPRYGGAVTEGPSTACRLAEPRRSGMYNNISSDQTIDYKNILSSSMLQIGDFSQFRAYVLENYTGKPLCAGAPGFMATTIISMSLTGYLHNSVSNKDLKSEEAIKVWQWLYDDPSRLLNINGVA